MTTDSHTQKAATVEVKNLSKSFGRQKVLSNISFEVNPSEIFVIMGPSGSGKSVLLKNIMGLEHPDTGKVLINGLDAADPSTHGKANTAMVFQGGALFQSMTVFDNLAFYPKEHRLYSKHEIRERVYHTLSVLSLEKDADKYPSKLSGGMRKRVAIARALMMEPQLIVYDEPTSELDPTMAANIAEIIGTLKEGAVLKEGFAVTTIVVSHDKDLAINIADRVAILFEGQIEVILPPKELIDFKNDRVQEFLHPIINLENPRFKQTV